ncbi:MAG: DUF4981 domain-containing protein [Nocardia sp.]|nr:DUF4981 domain-containing protein [Nocardia sp.]
MIGPMSITGLPWDDSGFHAVGRLPMHSLRRPPEFELDGEWQFQLLDTPTQPLGDRWRQVTVPELWTMREDCDPPHYTNVPMPYPEAPPRIPQRNPTGVYRRTIDLPSVGDRRVILHVGAAEGLLRVFVNDQPIGTSTDSHLAAEFDVTQACVPGVNTVVLVVSKWSSVTYLEDQDHWWQSGLSRSVYLYTVAPQHLSDLHVHGDYDPATERGALRAVVSTAGLDQYDSEAGWTIEVSVLGSTEIVPVTPRRPAPALPPPVDDRSARAQPRFPEDALELMSLRAADATIPERLAVFAPRFGQSLHAGPAAGTAVLERDDLVVEAWSAETPRRYEVEVRLLAPDGTVADTARTMTGFRRVVIQGRDLLVNGARILVQGVNRHDVHSRTGRVIGRDDMIAELSVLKRCNVNAIRTAHYPNDPEFLSLCDEFGFYVVGEADIEGHAFASALCEDPQYLPAFTERVSRMVLRDRSHPCVIMWSLGNETGYGANHDAVAAWLRSYDPTRPVHYEGAISMNWHGGHGATDVLCPMYPAFDAVRAYAADPRADRPFIMCEYAYSQGNSTGSLAEYWRLIETLPGVQGGFIWCFKDQALDPAGDGTYRYGGDFGDGPNNGPALLYGLVFPDNTPKPALYEARGLFSPVRIVSDADQALAGTLTLRNRHSFADLSRYILELRVETPDGPTQATRLPVAPVAAGAEATIDLPLAVRELLAAHPLALTLIVRTRHATVWAAAETAVAYEQVLLPRPLVTLPAATAPVVGIDTDGVLRHPLLRRAPRLCLWRALTDNDCAVKMDQRFARTGFFRLTPKAVEVDRDGEAVTIRTHYLAAFGDDVLHTRTVRAGADGDYVFSEHVRLPEGTSDGLRVGMEFELVDGFTDASWVGLGPWENYPDRRTSALLGRWHRAIDDLPVPYLRPQENGGRGEVTELVLSGSVGTITTGHQPLHVTVGRHTVEQLEAAAHWWELPRSDATVVHLDIAHRGLGDILGPDTLPEFRLTGTEYAWQWRLRPEQAAP